MKFISGSLCLTLSIIVITSSLNAQYVLMPYRKGNLWGYADTSGKIVVKPQFDWANLFKDDYDYTTIVKRSERQEYLGLIKNTGQVIIPPIDFTSYDIPGNALIRFGSSSTYLPERLRESLEKPAYNHGNHWTDSLPLLIFARKSRSYYKKDSLYIFDSTGKQLTFEPVNLISILSYVPFKYYFLVERNDKYGVFSQNGKTVVPIEYQMLQCVYEEKGNYINIAKKNNRYGLISMANKVIIPFVNDEIRTEKYNGNILLIIRRNKEEAVYAANLKLIDGFKKGRVLIERVYKNNNVTFKISRDTVNKFESGEVAQGVGVIEVPKDEIRSETGYVEAPREEGPRPDILKIISENGLFGLKKGDSLLIRPKYSKLQPTTIYKNGHKAGYFIATINGRMGVIDEYNNTVIPFDYISIEQCLQYSTLNNPLFLVQNKKGLKGVIDFKKETIIPLKYQSIIKVEKYTGNANVIFACSDDKKTIFYSNAGDTLFSVGFPTVQSLSVINSKYDNEQFWVISDKDSGTGLIDNHGHLLIQAKYATISILQSYSNDKTRNFFLVTSKDGMSGLFSLKGEQLIKPVFESIYPFRNFTERGRITSMADTAFYFVAGKDSLFGIVDMYGNEKLPLKYSSKFTFLSTGLPYIVVAKNGLRGLATFIEPDLIPLQCIDFPSNENMSERLNSGVIVYRSTEEKSTGNIGVFLVKNNKLVRQLPAIYKSVWGGRSGSMYRKYFSFFALYYVSEKGGWYDYFGNNGVLFFED